MSSSEEKKKKKKDKKKEQEQEEVTEESKKKYLFDRYGFLLPPEEEIDEKKEQKKRKKEIESIDLWREMIDNWKKFSKNNKLLKKRIYAGIPDRYRGIAWRLITGSDLLQKAKEGEVEYGDLHISNENPESESVIVKDINRTFPDHENYKSGDEQKRLYRVLKAWSIYDQEVGYCQGMAFIAGLLLFYMEEQEAFWTFVVLMKDFHMSALFREGFPLLQQQLFQWDKVLKKYATKLYKHFQNENIMPSMYASSWFLTIFARVLPFPLVLRIWDIYLYEGMIFIFRISLAILKVNQKKLLSLPFEEIVLYFKDIETKIGDWEKLLKSAGSFNISYKLIEKWADEWCLQNQK
ncbi:rab-gtpase-tbc domain-containing protein-related [Anaeramoeba flamelloides]|uniref:Rab-gtpase-tbc domain-containing protein-related n=1 Tax=Anaeramoeba flamelloides TaxID=1746091 RepID=A0ABQ8Z4Z2_9EUKA|nr:rab-gtpase-tbc domain-containing protein-related [Anaeramoeba flamelloides]